MKSLTFDRLEDLPKSPGVYYKPEPKESRTRRQRVERITLELPVKLTAEELMEKGQAMATAILQYDKYEAEKKEVMKDLGDKMKDLHVELTALGTVVDRKAEVRPVECKVQLDSPTKGKKVIIRLDTRDVVKEEAMTLEDSQEKLPLETVTVN